MSAPAPASMPMTTSTAAKAATTQPQPTLAPQPQSWNPQHRPHPSQDDELIEETFKDSNRFRWCWSPYWCGESFKLCCCCCATTFACCQLCSF